MRKLLVPLLLIVLVNVWVLGRVAYNRMGEPAQQLMLTERELALPYRWKHNSENSGLSLSLRWQTLPEDVAEHRHWRSLAVSEVVYNRLGFTRREQCPSRQRGGQPLPTEAWVMLEYDGPHYRQYLQQMREHVKFQELNAEPDSHAVNNARTRWHKAREEESRLFAVAVDTSIEPLLELQRDGRRYWLSPALVAPSDDCMRPQVRVVRLLSGSIAIPLQHRRLLEHLRPRPYSDDPQPPRYSVKLAAGQLYEPWVMAVETCPSEHCAEVVE